MNIVVVMAGMGGACAGFLAGLFAHGHIDTNTAATVVGAGLGAALSVWGALAAVSHQAQLKEREFEEFAIEAVRKKRPTTPKRY